MTPRRQIQTEMDYLLQSLRLAISKAEIDAAIVRVEKLKAEVDERTDPLLAKVCADFLSIACVKSNEIQTKSNPLATESEVKA
jgi:hypothetical protein